MSAVFDIPAIARSFPHKSATMPIDTRPSDITFVNPSDGTPHTFIETRKLY